MRHAPPALLALFLVTLPAPAAEIDYGPEDASPWLENVLTWDKSFVDVSFLNHRPAGKFGRVLARGERFVFEKTGKPVRFWSCNVVGKAAFGPEHDEAVAKRHLTVMADRIAALGFNHVRLHHLDVFPGVGPGRSAWEGWAGPSIVDYSGGTSLKLNEKAIDRVDYLIWLLKERGVYCYVDLHNLRRFLPGDGIGDLAELEKVDAGHKYAWHVDADLQRNMQAFNALLAKHRNRYTGLTWGEDPAICMAVLANENDFTFYTAKQVLDNPTYRQKTLELAKQFAERGELGVRPEDALRFVTPPFNRFAAYVEQTVYRDMIRRARADGWTAALICGGNWTFRGLPNVVGKARSGHDFMDNHVYQSETCFLLDDPAATRTIFNKVANAHVAGMPFCVSEWHTSRSGVNQYHVPHRASSIVGMAATAAHQGWDLASIFCYASEWEGQKRRGFPYDSYLDPGSMGPMPAAAVMYRRDVAEGDTNTVLLFDDEDTFSGKWDGWGTSDADKPASPLAHRTAQEQSKTTLAFGKLPEGLAGKIRVVGKGEYEKNLLENPNGATSDTGQVTRDWKAGYQTVDTPGSQMAQGIFGGGELRTSDVVFRPRTKFAVLVVTSLTERPISRGGRLLLTAMSTTRRVGPEGSQTYRSQCVDGTVTVRFAAPPSSVRLVPLFGDGSVGPARDLEVSPDGSVNVDLLTAKTHWYLMETQ